MHYWDRQILLVNVSAREIVLAFWHFGILIIGDVVMFSDPVDHCLEPQINRRLTASTCVKLQPNIPKWLVTPTLTSSLYVFCQVLGEEI
jgi:hypothetical protein